MFSASEHDRLLERIQAKKLLKKLSLREQRILHWYYIEELTYQEIASKLQLSRERIRQIIRQIIMHAHRVTNSPRMVKLTPQHHNALWASWCYVWREIAHAKWEEAARSRQQVNSRTSHIIFPRFILFIPIFRSN